MSYHGKALMLGDASVGKTSLLARYINNEFPEEYNQTIGANFIIKEVDLRGVLSNVKFKDPKLMRDIETKGFKIYWWDVGGQQDKLFVTEYYFDYAVGAVVVFDILNRESFESLEFWISKMKDLSGDVPFIIIGNKIDKNNERKVSIEEGEKKARSYNVEYIETSAKLNENVTKAFELIAIKILENTL